MAVQSVLGAQLDGFEPLDIFGTIEHVAAHGTALVHPQRHAYKGCGPSMIGRMLMCAM